MSTTRVHRSLLVEQPAIELFAHSAGKRCRRGARFSVPAVRSAARRRVDRLRSALVRLNLGLPPDEIRSVIDELTAGC